MRKTVFLVLLFLSVVVLVVRFAIDPLTSLLGLNAKAGIKISSTPEATVFLNDQEVGKTPFQDEALRAGEYLIKLSSDNGSWQGKVKIKGGTLAVVNRELGAAEASSSGEVLTLVTGRGVTIGSNPPDSEVEIDGKVVGQTPLHLPGVSPGEHTFLLSHSNYLKRSIRAYVPESWGLYRFLYPIANYWLIFSK